MYTSKLKIKLLTVVIVSILAVTAKAQDGRWVQYDLSTIGAYDSGTGARGDGLICFAPEGSRYFLVFDIQGGAWQTFDLGEAQDFDELDTRGHVVFAYSDNMLFGYSDIGMVWDTVSYDGTLMDPIHGFGMSDNLAYFITEMYLYVFDAGTGEWASYDYTLPADYTSMYGWVRSDFVAIALGRTYPAHPTNVVYSYHTHGFNEITEGAYYTSPEFDHGFARFMDNSVDDICMLVGYSAYDNQFDIEEYTLVDGEYRIGASNGGSIPTDEFTVCMDAFRYAVSYEYVEAVHFAYDTRYGEWVRHDLHINHGDGGYSGNCHYGGRMASDFYTSSADDAPHWIIFDGENNTFREPVPELDTGDNWGFRIGGNAMLSWDGTKAWGYNVSEGIDAMTELTGDHTALVESGQDFHTLTRWSSSSDNMRTYFYNSRTNSWHSVNLPDHHTNHGIASAHYYMHCAGSEYNLVYYSSPLDQVITMDLPDATNISKKINGDLAWAADTYMTFLFNGLTGSYVTFDFNLAYLGKLGTNSAIGYSNDDDLLYGYNPLTGTITTHDFTENPYNAVDTGYVGVVMVNYNGGNYNKIYTYNALADNWIELIPTGVHSSILVGTKTALISRTQTGSNPDYLYAFDPQREVTDINEDNNNGMGALPLEYSLNQNYPNPFNASTSIRYELPSQGDVRIEIFDLLGRKVKTLIDSEQPAGIHQAVWHADGIASGMYLYKITTGNYTETKKMVLMK